MQVRGVPLAPTDTPGQIDHNLLAVTVVEMRFGSHGIHAGTWSCAKFLFLERASWFL